MQLIFLPRSKAEPFEWTYGSVSLTEMSCNSFHVKKAQIKTSPQISLADSSYGLNLSVKSKKQKKEGKKEARGK